jgi:hypothetical protein
MCEMSISKMKCKKQLIICLFYLAYLIFPYFKGNQMVYVILQAICWNFENMEGRAFLPLLYFPCAVVLGLI